MVAQLLSGLQDHALSNWFVFLASLSNPEFKDFVYCQRQQKKNKRKSSYGRNCNQPIFNISVFKKETTLKHLTKNNLMNNNNNMNTSTKQGHMTLKTPLKFLHSIKQKHKEELSVAANVSLLITSFLRVGGPWHHTGVYLWYLYKSWSPPTGSGCQTVQNN